MTSRQRNEEILRALCASVGSDDGVNPRDDKRRSAKSGSRPDRKLRQLCRQAAHVLHLALGALPQTDALVGASIRNVTPAPNANRLLVSVTVPELRQKEAVAAILRRYSGFLRSEVATAIARRRAPELAFDVWVEGGVHE